MILVDYRESHCP